MKNWNTLPSMDMSRVGGVMTSDDVADCQLVGADLLYLSSTDSAKAPKRLVFAGRTWTRFVERIYTTTPVFDLPQSEVIAVCDLRLQNFDDAIDRDFHDAMMGEMIAQAKDLSPDASVIADFGCGSGALARQLRVAYPRAAVLGLDVSVLALEAFREAIPMCGCVLIEAGSFPVRMASFDLVAAAFVFHFSATWLVLPELVLALRPGGIFLATFYGGRHAEFIASCDRIGLRLVGRHDFWTGRSHHLLLAFVRS